MTPPQDSYYEGGGIGDCTSGKLPSLRQQQRARCRGKVGKMQLARALIACSDGNPLPTVGGLLAMSSSSGRVSPSTDSGRSVRRSRHGRCADARPSLCRGRSARQRDIAL